MPKLEPEKCYNILFWNCHKKNNDDVFQSFLKDLLCDEKIDLFCLAECVENSQDQLNEFRSNISTSNDIYKYVGCSEKKKDTLMYVFTSLPYGTYSVIRNHAKPRYINVKIFDKVEIVFVHLKSMLSTDHESKIEEDKDVLSDVYNGCSSPKFFIGDFNSTPYSSSLLHSRVFNSIREGEGNVKSLRKEMYNHKRRINPSWDVYGKASYSNSVPLGTYFHTASSYTNIGWELIDQVIFDEKLSPFYVENSFRILSSNSKNIKLTNVKGRINPLFSDHLPIVFSLKGV